MTADQATELTDATDLTMTYVVEQQVEETQWEVIGVRLSLDAANALGERALGDSTNWGSPREWTIEWRESTDTTHLDPDTALRQWGGHRPGNFYEKPYETYVGVTITEHPVPQDQA